MKKLLTSYFSLSRRERLGFTALIILISIPLSVYLLSPLFIHPPTLDGAANKKLREQWLAFKTASGTPIIPQSEGNPTGTLFAFDPNTLDSTAFIQLGMSPKAVKGLLNWRRHGKHFYNPEDLKPLYNLSEEEYARLAPYIAIAATGEDDRPYQQTKWTNNYRAPPAIVDINSTDTTTLDRAVRGIGAALARRIITRRNALGGYLKFEQIIDGLRLPDSTIIALKEKVRIDPSTVKRINLNTVTAEQLSAHPFIGAKLAKGIIQLRGGYGKYTSIEQLRQAPLMTEEIYRKIAPYFTLE